MTMLLVIVELNVTFKGLNVALRIFQEKLLLSLNKDRYSRFSEY